MVNNYSSGYFLCWDWSLGNHPFDGQTARVAHCYEIKKKLTHVFWKKKINLLGSTVIFPLSFYHEHLWFRKLLINRQAIDFIHCNCSCFIVHHSSLFPPERRFYFASHASVLSVRLREWPTDWDCFGQSNSEGGIENCNWQSPSLRSNLSVGMACLCHNLPHFRLIIPPHTLTWDASATSRSEALLG